MSFIFDLFALQEGVDMGEKVLTLGIVVNITLLLLLWVFTGFGIATKIFAGLTILNIVGLIAFKYMNGSSLF